MEISKLKAVKSFLKNFVIFVAKKPVGWVFYPVAYLFYDWVMEGVERKNYIRPEAIFSNPIKWLFYMFYDADQPPQGPLWYRKDYCKCNCELASKWLNFICAYRWSGLRNTMYNVNYIYLSQQSEIIGYDKVFGTYSYNRKLRASNGDAGAQLVFMKRANGNSTFLFSAAYHILGKIPFTLFFGWNADYNGRFTLAMKFK